MTPREPVRKDHDELCPVVTHRLRKSWCQCDLIDAVRVDQTIMIADHLHNETGAFDPYLGRDWIQFYQQVSAHIQRKFAAGGREKVKARWRRNQWAEDIETEVRNKVADKIRAIKIMTSIDQINVEVMREKAARIAEGREES